MIKNRFVLIDAFALIFRAYYALPPSLTKDGQPIQAAYGFTSALLSAIKTLEPEYVAVGFDLPKPTRRHQEYVDYKAHRAPMPKELKPQIPYTKEILKVMNIPTYGVEGYEGEDIVATIVAKCKNQKSKIKNMEFIIVTGDMDLLQLVDEHTKVYSIARGVNQASIYNQKKVIERYDLDPAQFVDFKALKGDASDNIPGVKGIGEKTAAKLIQEFGTLEKLYQTISNFKFQISNEIQNSNFKIDSKFKIKNLKLKNAVKIPKDIKISPKIIRLLLEQKEQAKLSQKLSKIQTNVPLEFHLGDAHVHDYNGQAVVKLFKQLGFKSLIPRLPEAKQHRRQEKLL